MLVADSSKPENICSSTVHGWNSKVSNPAAQLFQTLTNLTIIRPVLHMPHFSAFFQTISKYLKNNCTNKHLQPKLKSQIVCVCVWERERERALAYIRTPPYQKKEHHLKSSKRRPWPVCENSWFSSHIENYQIQIQIQI